jgi:hypothetical protein
MVKSLHAKEHSGKSANAESRHWNKVLTARKEKMVNQILFQQAVISSILRKWQKC